MVATLAARPAAVAVGLLADRAFGEPPADLHPVACFGAWMEGAEARLWADSRLRGASYCALGVGGAYGLGVLAEALLGPAAALALAVAICGAGRSLCEAGAAVATALEAGDLDGARSLVRTLVGRDVSEADEKEIARAAVESLAENLSDAVVGTAVWGLLGGAPAALVHRAANTLDAMVGHRTVRHGRFGWASARLDDLLGWPAARMTALAVAAAFPGRARAVLRAWRFDAPRHPSPNAGVAEAAVAAALDLRLGGTNRYGGRIDERPPLGTGAPPVASDIRRAIGLVSRVEGVLGALLVGVSVCTGRSGRWRRRGSAR